MKFENKVVVLTGGVKGIGRCITPFSAGTAGQGNRHCL